MTNYQKRSGYFGWTAYVVGNSPHLSVSTILQNSDKFEFHKDLFARRIGAHLPSMYIQFKYRNSYFTLYGNCTICLMTDNWEEKLTNPNDKNGYYFTPDAVTTEELLISQLELMLAESQSATTQH